ncbi:hypothetical protein C809_01678 [Lachnospiraceae bacterium MD335]|nr:hypothetical protein C809_01678 [Lachnospiraceae bacterium MD335]
MASIQKRGKKHAVVYTYTDQEGQKRQKWETFNTKAEARKRKSAVEAELDNGTFIPPNTTTVEDFLKEFVDLYGEKKWGLSIYASNTALINNYINPLIGKSHCRNRAHIPWNRLRPCSTLAAQPHISSSSRRSSGSSA